MSMEKTNALPEMVGAALFDSPGKKDAWNWLLMILILASLAFMVYISAAGKLIQMLLEQVDIDHWTSVLVRPSVIWALMGSLLLVFRTFMWFRYRPFKAASLEDAPALTVIIPAYNEGEMVEKTIDSVAAALYPRDRLEILVVDDGSKDDTWQYIQRAANRYPGLVSCTQFSQNQGKRAALEEGFRRARGEVVITIDSDSVIERGTLLAMAGPFRNPKIGAVAGKVAVYNQKKGLIPRMLHVRFILSFDFLRAVQSTYGTVYCCPGALAAYRTSVVREVLDEWMNQTFMGVACTYGEDRALTNFIIERGYDTVYQRTGVVHTIVPTTYSRLCKMYLRWDRSYIREEIRFLKIVWKRPLAARIIAMVDSFITNLRYPVSLIALVLLVSMAMQDPMTIVRVLVIIGVMSSLTMLYYLHSERSWKVVYGVFYSYYAFFALFWIFPYALMTVRAKSWLTR